MVVLVTVTMTVIMVVTILMTDDNDDSNGDYEDKEGTNYDKNHSGNNDDTVLTNVTVIS